MDVAPTPPPEIIEAPRISADTIDILKGCFYGLVAAGLVYLAVIGMLTLLNVDSIVGNIKVSQSNHSQTLHSLTHVAQQNHDIDTKLKQELKDLGYTTQQIDQILQLAGTASHNVQENEYLICQDLGIHTCVPAS